MEFAIALVVLALVFLIWALTPVRQGFAYTIERFGRFTEVAKPGLNFYPAFFYAVGSPLPFPEANPWKMSKRYRFFNWLGNVMQRRD